VTRLRAPNLSGLSPRRRYLLLALAAVLVVALAVAAIELIPGPRRGVVAQDRPGPVLLVPGYGGGTGGVDPLAAHIRATGREATVVPLPGDGRGDLAQQAEVLDGYVQRALNAGAPSVDLIGYSAGGVVVRYWAQTHDAATKARRIITLGSPHHGASIAGVGAVAVPGACPTACQQLAPGSEFLRQLATPVPAPPQWLSVWTDQDQTVTPPDSARLEGATNVELQAVCPKLTVDHSGLPTNPVVVVLVLRAIGVAPVSGPTAADCVSS
jgi:pimeloyl-ACP methyl ester carboxylesterase